MRLCKLSDFLCYWAIKVQNRLQSGINIMSFLPENMFSVALLLFLSVRCEWNYISYQWKHFCNRVSYNFTRDIVFPIGVKSEELTQSAPLTLQEKSCNGLEEDVLCTHKLQRFNQKQVQHFHFQIFYIHRICSLKTKLCFTVPDSHSNTNP